MDLAGSREGRAWAPITCTEHTDRGSSSTLTTGQLWVLEALHPQAHPLHKGCSEGTGARMKGARTGPASAHLLLLTSTLSPKWETQFVDWSPVLIPDIGICRGKANTQPTVCPWAGAPGRKLDVHSGFRLPSLPTTHTPASDPRGRRHLEVPVCPLLQREDSDNATSQGCPEDYSSNIVRHTGTGSTRVLRKSVREQSRLTLPPMFPSLLTPPSSMLPPWSNGKLSSRDPKLLGSVPVSKLRASGRPHALHPPKDFHSAQRHLPLI